MGNGNNGQKHVWESFRDENVCKKHKTSIGMLYNTHLNIPRNVNLNPQTNAPYRKRKLLINEPKQREENRKDQEQENILIDKRATTHLTKNFSLPYEIFEATEIITFSKVSKMVLEFFSQ